MTVRDYAPAHWLRWFRILVLGSISPGAVISRTALRFDIKSTTVLDPGLAPEARMCGTGSGAIV
jgi:hypothetical protein